MIFKENITINGQDFIRTYSNTNMVMRDGVEYEEAIDPAELGREYTEGSTLPPEEITDEEALAIITGGTV